MKYQNRNVTAAITKTAAMKCPATLSAVLWIGGFFVWASLTSVMIFERTVSAPTDSARKVNVPVRFCVDPVTREPSPIRTGILSPVSMDSSTEDVPERTVPSTGIFSPGRTITISPTMTSSVGISISFSVFFPVSVFASVATVFVSAVSASSESSDGICLITCETGASKDISFLTAAVVFLRDLSSRNFPNVTKTRIMATVS